MRESRFNLCFSLHVDLVCPILSSSASRRCALYGRAISRNFAVVLHSSSFWSLNCVNSQFDRSKGSVAKEGRN